ncbi:MAG TPA: carboxypeptidase regulatory-like domain-containing protein, partial [Pyrinomonadaceae bacterium]|nr:carboxypeptidase regulatory-like domain-containing protein [Pyrinomonadaceae bacterium]
MTSRRHRLSSKPLLAIAAAALFLVADCFSLLGARSAFSARAQSATATLSGTVMDEAGAVIPAVQITLLNLDTALQRHAVTDDNGSYVVPLLPPGRYNVTAQREGFGTVEIRNVVLNTGDQQALRVKLKVGEIGESVTVIEDPSSVQESIAVGTTVNRNFVEHLPLNGRSFQSLFGLTPGVVLTRASFNEQGQFSVNGQRANANYFMVDGVSANIGVSAGSAPGQSAGGSLPALTALGSTNNLVSIDALEEFRILTSTYAAEFGRTPGAQVSIITRSGTNEFRGTLFNYFRNDALDAGDWFANSRGLRRPAIRQNDFGGVLGGPIVRDRAFFFSSYEGLRLRQPQVAITEVPSLSARLLAPASIKPFLNAFPIPNGPETQAGFAEFAASYSDPSSLNATSLRIDAVVSERLAVFGRYNYATSATTQRGSTIVPGFSVQTVVNPTVSQSLNNLSRAELNTETVTWGATLSFSTRTVNDLRVNWSRARGATTFSLDDFGGAASLPSSLLFPSSAAPEDAGFQFLLNGGINSSLVVGKNVDNLQRQVNLVDNLSLVRGSHQLKFGVDYRRLTPVYNSLRYNQSVVYDGVTGDAGSPPGTALSGIARSVQVFAGADPRFPVFTNFSAYAQDTSRVTPRLALVYGLRWEVNPPPVEAHGNSPFTVQNLDEPATITLAPRGTRLWKTTYNNFAPRVGLAYQLSDEQGQELVFRGGIGIFYDLGNGQSAQGFGSVFPFVAVKRFTNVPYPLSPEQATPPPFSLDPPFGTVIAFDPNLKLPRTFQWNLALERSLGPSQTIAVAYVGSIGQRLLREDVLLNSNQNFPLIRVTRNAAESSYHSMQAQYVRRLSNGLQALVSYTWAHSIDNASSDSLSRVRIAGATGTVGEIASTSSTVRGPSDFDVRHSLSAAVTYNLPAPRADSVWRAVLRNWSIDGIWRARTAAPVNVVVRSDVIGDDLIVELQRPDLVEGVPLYIADPTAPGGRRINRDAFVVPTELRQGTLGYNALRGFGVTQLDVALRRQFSLGERFRLQFKTEVFNLFNHPNFGNPNNVLSSSSFGRSTQMFGRSLGNGGINGGLSPLYQVGGPRSVQLALK